MRMTSDLTKFVTAAQNAPTRVLLTTIALAVVAPITMQHNLLIVLPLVLILGMIVWWLIAADRGQ
jgi:hypothetical protein